ncbi:MAG: hypothetical protein IJV41_09835 [Oscillospiraceae bacterium]|nr:hypothetical protein [Oscillospiraceae bacterium]
MDYPLIIDGHERGSVTCAQDGLYTVLEASLTGESDALVRLWAHGGGESAYLGLMQPWSGGLYLRRKLSRSERARLPEVIEYVSDKEGLHKNKLEPEKKEKQDSKGQEDLHNNNNKPVSDCCAYPSPIAEETGDLLWLRRSDGSLTAFDGVSSLLALPTSMAQPNNGAVLRRIEGQNYLIFRY